MKRRAQLTFHKSFAGRGTKVTSRRMRCGSGKLLSSQPPGWISNQPRRNSADTGDLSCANVPTPVAPCPTTPPPQPHCPTLCLRPSGPVRNPAMRQRLPEPPTPSPCSIPSLLCRLPATAIVDSAQQHTRTST
jgi:hypothetical protein